MENRTSPGQAGKRGRRVPLRRTIVSLMAAGLASGLALLGWSTQRARSYGKLLERLSDCHPRVEWRLGRPVEICLSDAVGNFNLDDADLGLLARIRSLESLSIRFAPRLSSSGFAALGRLSSLEALRLEMTRFGDRDVAVLRRLRNLRRLSLGETNVSDRAVDTLIELKSLTSLDVFNSRITLAGYRRLVENLVLHGSCTIDGVIHRGNAAAVLEQLPPKEPEPPEISGGGTFNGPRSVWGDRYNVLVVAEATMDRVFIQLLWCVPRERWEEMGFSSWGELRSCEPFLFDALRPYMPRGLAAWFAEHRTLAEVKPAEHGGRLTMRREVAERVAKGLRVVSRLAFVRQVGREIYVEWVKVGEVAAR